MKRLGQAIRVFFRILQDGGFGERVAQVEKAPAKAPSAPAATPAVAAPPRARRNDAVTLLALLQRDGRLVDFLQEPIDGYSDAQIGAAVRDVHRACKLALDRIFGLAPVITSAEGSPQRIERGYDAGRTRLTGKVTGAPPHNGVVVHPGWEATRCELPEWSGSDQAARVIAPAEVEIK